MSLHLYLLRRRAAERPGWGGTNLGADLNEILRLVEKELVLLGQAWHEESEFTAVALQCKVQHTTRAGSLQGQRSQAPASSSGRPLAAGDKRI